MEELGDEIDSSNRLEATAFVDRTDLRPFNTFKTSPSVSKVYV